MVQHPEGNKGRIVLGAIAVAAVVAVGFLLGPAGASHQPADKVAVTSGSIEILGVPLMMEGMNSEEVTLLEGTIKTSNTVDLLFAVTLECALWTDITTVGNGESEAEATVKVWVEFDGVVVPVSADDLEDTGRVVFCNRLHRQTVMDLDDEDAQISQFLRTRSANAFNWALLNVGSQPAPHTIEVKAVLETQVAGIGEAQAGIGKRSLIVEPQRLSVHAEI